MCVIIGMTDNGAGTNQLRREGRRPTEPSPPPPPSKPIRFDVDDDVVDWAEPEHTIARVISYNLGLKDSLVLALKIPSYPCL